MPATAKSVAINLTVTQPTGAGHLTLSPGDFILPPTASTINFAARTTRANNAILPLATNGAGTVVVDPVLIGAGTVHLIIDVLGYFE
ncbi:MAG TPA: hypothetical protein VGQ28_07440 [Thermoanaerobaculia bacterium]|nr:hypothetical protein [Thermoanaerobaculia bacterium]